jgi:hypothetical protein
MAGDSYTDVDNSRHLMNEVSVIVSPCAVHSCGVYGWSSATAIFCHGEANAPRVVECRGPQKVVCRMNECNGYFHQIHGCDGVGSIVIILCS